MPLSPHWRWKINRWRERAAGMFRSEPELSRPRLCPSCGKLAGVHATKCPECGASLTYSLAAASRSLSRLLPSTSPATYAILFLTCLLYALSLVLTLRAGGNIFSPSIWNLGAPSALVLLKLGARQAILIFYQNEWWRLLTPVFLHGSLIHIGFNMWVLMDIGPMTEELYGSPRYLSLYVFTGIIATLVSAVWSMLSYGGFGISIGASGALMGLIGVLLGLTTRRRTAAMQMLRSQLLRWLVYILLLSLLPGVDMSAHLGGLAAGFLLGRYVEDREPATPAERKRAYALGWLAGLAVFASFAAMFASFFRLG
jgi:membrane associated rhomboid family serine protease